MKNSIFSILKRAQDHKYASLETERQSLIKFWAISATLSVMSIILLIVSVVLISKYSTYVDAAPIKLILDGVSESDVENFLYFSIATFITMIIASGMDCYLLFKKIMPMQNNLLKHMDDIDKMNNNDNSIDIKEEKDVSNNL